MTWSYDPAALSKTLEAAGFDVDDSQARGLGGGGSLTARRDRNDGTITVAVDSGGRLKVMVTRPLAAANEENPEINGLPLRVLTERSESKTIAAQLDDPKQLTAVLHYVEQPSAGSAAQAAAVKHGGRTS